ncbi:carbohydrate ABC transporter substrate-binding protein (CUT1 family) [Promicromonospora sp. AC04]|uniref:ABC transporter substrate-binding protein n=1 Tax=Promicromonospora sp. AC04 TaxID=2135723 RepID=UPI000D480DE9|nr:ABC transporter substrate-binding protein [Promicromonospora sp. AC04]PUB27064.1 carbohydrate ABC transporter substrate-binding protein (CUT1 family) [Promicromonospora sp. AC04]
MSKRTTISERALTRRELIAGGMTLGAASLLAACVGTTTGGGGGGAATTGAVTLQNSVQDAEPKAALEALVKAYQGDEVTLNSVATEQFRAQLTNYLRSGDAPEVLSWYAGSVARSYADEGLLLDVSPLWQGDGVCAGYSDALRGLSTDAAGKQIFVPTSYYWWSVFYKKSAFEKWGVEAPTSWDEFHALCENLSGQGIAPLTNGLSSTPWMASGWFDYLNLRVNGAQYHRELLAGEHAFNDPEVVAVMEEYKRLIPYFDKNAASYTAQDAATPVAQDKSAMYLVGAFVTSYFPEDQRDDLDFFSVPVINDSVPIAEEAPTDGYFAAANSDNHQGALDLLSYLASTQSQQQYIEQSGSANLPTSPDVDTSGLSPLVQKGIELLNNTEEITQFFNRDSSDALQATADTALTKFLAVPDSMKSILDEWQTAAEGVFAS